MSLVRRLFSRLVIAAALSLAGASGCTSSLETEPVNLPVPFSGALTVDTQVAVSNGPPLHQGILFGHPSGDQWELQDSSGRSVGVATFFLDTASPLNEDANGRIVFTMNVALDFDDGSGVVVEGVQFFDYPFDAPPNSGAAEAAPGETGAQVISRKGVASGRIVAGTGRFVSAVGETADHRYLYEDVRHADGNLTFFAHNFSTWLIHGATGGLGPGTPAIGGQVLATLFENGSDLSELPGGALKVPLFCPGGFQCGEETDSDFVIESISEEHVAFNITVTVCQAASCVTTRHTRFVADLVPELQGLVTKGSVYQTTMTQHDPIPCGDATGVFSAAACAGTLKLDYRCLSVVEVQPGSPLDASSVEPISTLAGSYIISTTP